MLKLLRKGWRVSESKYPKSPQAVKSKSSTSHMNTRQAKDFPAAMAAYVVKFPAELKVELNGHILPMLIQWLPLLASLSLMSVTLLFLMNEWKWAKELFADLRSIGLSFNFGSRHSLRFGADT